MECGARFCPPSAHASRFGLDRTEVWENVLDFEAFEWVTRSEFAGNAGWSLTDSGRAENERRLAAELDAFWGPLHRGGGAQPFTTTERPASKKQ